MATTREGGMTERKPHGTTFETWIERQIRVAQERGDFEDLDGLGRPLPGAGEPHDELWWVRGYVDREGLSREALLPTPLQLRKEAERLRGEVRQLPSEQAVRDAAAELNRRILAWLRTPTGPQVPLGLVQVEELVADWRDQRARARATAPAAPVRAEPSGGRWQRITRFLRGTSRFPAGRG
ncbi:MULTISPECIES: DUF1992 domain-containing protein [unclassified Saccharopolyspora]|uniref:DnaJ family domain-containing protein n=1 Tax=unclassified Saccharopolyspora TaxID=2646250 RepID=UPI001CD5EF82|nr:MULTISPECIES: DUF1992 domain-containing protein [unclassified Saccharopolyspora]MCA1189047.1 DUF1992 domain-containing protein [Saccharopolyspora sp. 6T]MCA1282912.1 DUF1992 domain-containing protein [Saccharopolyspora sp. 7B]